MAFFRLGIVIFETVLNGYKSIITKNEQFHNEHNGQAFR